MANPIKTFFSPKANVEAVGRMFKPAKNVLVDAPTALFKGSKAVLYDAPKGLKNLAFSKKGLAVVGVLAAGLAAIGGLVSRSGRGKFENLQEQEATDLKASIEANRMARVETSSTMGQGGSPIPYREDWGQRVKGGLPGLPPTV